ncbi:MAG TPA: aldo/keto reductase [Spirochaetia bacterium]|nr:aldo/keto reductase [Spirochaetia bacterium]
MEYRRLGSAGIKVSALSLGSWVTFGNQVDVDSAVEAMKTAYDAGCNFFDNAEAYAAGKSEEIMGKALKKLGWRRGSYLVSTKIYWGLNDGPNEKNTLNRKRLREGIEGALKRFDLDYIDLVYCHRADPETPIEETVWSMHTMIERGQALYWGTSEWSAEEIREAWEVAERHHLHKPQMEQSQYNLFVRKRVEKEYKRIFDNLGYGLTVWSPLSLGILTGKYDSGVPEGSRLSQADFSSYTQGAHKKVLEQRINATKKLDPIARKLGCTRAQLALAWCAKNPNVSTVITGASRPEQVKENFAAFELVPRLTPDIMARIDRATSSASDL